MADNNAEIARLEALLGQIQQLRAGSDVKPTPVFPPELNNSGGPQLQFAGDHETFNGQAQPGMDGFVPPVLQGRSAGFAANYKAAGLDDIDTRIRVLASDLFPNDPEAVQRFGFRDGRVVYVDDDGRIYDAEGSGMGNRIARFSSDAPEAIGATIGGILGGLPGAGLGAAFGESVKRIGNNTMLDEPQSAGDNARAIATEGALGVAGEGVGKLMGGTSRVVADRNVVPGLDRTVDARIVKRVQDRVKSETGITLDAGQIMNMTSISQLRKWVAKRPGEAADIMQAHLKAQENDVVGAIQRILDAVNKESNRVQLGNQGINAAKAAIVNAKAQRSGLVADLYERAFERGVPVDTAPVLEVLDGLIQRSAGQNKRKLLSLRRDFFEDDEPLTGLEQLHGLRMAIDDMIEPNPANSAGGNLKRSYSEVRQSLSQAMKRSSMDLEEADAVFAELTEQLVTPIENSVIGVLAKLPAGKETKAALSMFRTADMSRSQMRFARQTIQRSDKEAWTGLVRLWLADQLDAAMKVTQSGQRINTAGKFRQRLEPTPRARAAILEALPRSARKVYDDVMEALEMASNAPLDGSDTSMNQVTDRQMADRSALVGVRRAVASPLQTLETFGQELSMERHALAIAEALLDPEKISKLSEFSRMSDGTQKAIEILSFLGVTQPVRSLAPVSGLAGPEPQDATNR